MIMIMIMTIIIMISSSNSNSNNNNNNSNKKKKKNSSNKNYNNTQQVQDHARTEESPGAHAHRCGYKCFAAAKRGAMEVAAWGTGPNGALVEPRRLRSRGCNT